MRVRSKISFMALLQRSTIMELWVTSILNTYSQFGLIANMHPGEAEKEEEMIINFGKIIKGDMRGFFKNIIQFNQQFIKGTHVEQRLKSLQRTKTIEEITVKQNGKIVHKSINLEKNKTSGDIIMKAMDKNVCTNMFRDLKNS